MITFTSKSQHDAYFHLLMTGAIACPTRELAAAYGLDRCPVCVIQPVGSAYRRVWNWNVTPSKSPGQE